MEEAGWVPRLVAEAERLRGLVLETSGQLPLHVLYDAALPALLQALQLVWVPAGGEEAGLAELLRSFAGGGAPEEEGRSLLFLSAASVLMRRALLTGDEKRAARMERQLAADLCLPILAIRPRKDSGLAPSVVTAAVKSGGGEEEANEAGDASPPAGNSPQAMERACTLLVDMVARDGTLEVSGLADDEGPRTRLGECLLDLARDQARILAARLQRSGTSSPDVGDDLARPHEGPFLLLRELLRTFEPAGPQVMRFRDDVLEPMLALLWTDDNSVRRVVFHELLPAFFARPQDASAVHLERLWREVHKMWLAGRSRGPAHRTFEGDAYLLMAKFVDHFLAASSSFDLRTDDQFWPFLQVGFYSSDGGVRKLANLLLKRVLAHTRQAANPATPLDFNTKYFSWPVKSNDKAWAKRWETFFLLQESLEEYNYHLVAPLWPQLAALFQASREGTAMDLSWAQALLERALRHENPITQKHALLHVLHNAEYARNVTESFVLGTVMEVCCDPSLFRGSLSRVTDRLLVAFLGAFFDALPDHQAQVGFVGSLLRAIAGHKPFASGALAAYFEFLQTIPPLALFISTSSALDDLLVIIEGHINFQPQSQRRALNGSVLVLLANSLSATYREAAAFSGDDQSGTQHGTRLLRGVKRALALLPEELLRPSASAGWSLMQAAFAIGAHAGVAQLPDFVGADLQRLWADEYIPLQTEHETDRVARMLALAPNTDAQDRIIADILEQIRRESHNAWALVVSVLSLAAQHGTVPDRVVDALRTGLRSALAGAEPDLLRVSLKASATAMILSLSRPPQPDDEHSPTPLRVTLNALLRSLVEPLLAQSPDQSPSVPRQQVGGPDVALQMLRGIYHAAPLLANCSNSSAEAQPAGLKVADLVLGLARSSPASSSSGRDRHAQLSRYMLLKWETIARLLRADDDTLPSATAAPVGRDVALQMLGEGAEALQAAESRCIVSILHSLRGTHPAFPLALVPCAFPDQRVDDADLELVATVLGQAWRALKESRDFETAAAFVGLAFQPALVCTPALSREPEAPLRQYCRGVRHIGKLFRGPAGLLARQLRRVWEQHPQAAVNFIPEIVRLCVFGHVRKGENEMSGCTMDPRSLCMQDVYVRGQVWAFLLWSGECDESASEQRQRHHQALIEQILEALLQCNASPSYSSECRLHSHQHRKRVRLWQAIGLIVGRYMGRSERVAELVRTHVLAALETPNFRNVRIVIELCGANFLLHRPDALLDHFLTFLSRVNDRPEMITSGLVVSGMVLRSLDPAHPAFMQIWLRVQPYLTCHHPTIRSIAQAAVARIVEARPDFLLGLEEGLRQQTNAVVHYLQTNAECKKVLDKHTEWLLLDTSPTSQLQPEAVLHRIPLMERSSSGEDLRPDLFALICQRPDEAARTLLLSSPDADAQPQLPLPPPVEGDSAAAAKTEAAIFQKKITPWSVAVNAEQEEMARHASGLPRAVVDPRQTEQVMSKRRQELIVVASLVDKLPNLAGLARTCEIFGASCLVLPSLKVTREAVFQSIAVTSEKWLPLVEVGEAGLVAYLRQKRAEGYALLGVEQTSGSTLLDAFTFPARCLLLLGREKQGIPPELIHLLDACVEIPQLGVIRSLNVHVSASIMVWEYTRQMRQRPKVEATNTKA